MYRIEPRLVSLRQQQLIDEAAQARAVARVHRPEPTIAQRVRYALNLRLHPAG